MKSCEELKFESLYISFMTKIHIKLRFSKKNYPMETEW